MNIIAMRVWRFPAGRRPSLTSNCCASHVARPKSFRRFHDSIFLARPTAGALVARSFSSRRSSDSSSDAFKSSWGLPFSVSPERALEKFEKWARNDQGLNSFLMRPDSVKIAAAYCPVWCFDVNIRYIVKDPATGRSRFDWKPDIFKVFGTQSVMHIPGLSSYAGYSYRRSLIDPLHNTSLIFLGDKLVHWSDWMLRDMKLQATGDRLTIFPDPWNATKGRAFSLVKEALETLPGASNAEDGERDVRVQTEITRSRRVYIPTFVIEYKVLGME